MGKKPTVRLRVYSGTKMSYDVNGKVQNENQKVTFTHDTVQWKNYLNNLKANGFCKVDVEAAFYNELTKDEGGYFVDNPTPCESEVVEAIKKEVERAFEDKAVELTPEQKKIAELEMAIKALQNGSAKMKETKADKQVEDKEPKVETSANDDRSTLVEEYTKVVGKRPFNGWDNDTIKAKLEEAKQTA